MVGVSSRVIDWGVNRVITLATVVGVAALIVLPAHAAQRVFMFNLQNSTSYSITKNSTPVGSENSSPAGTLIYSIAAAPGDQVDVVQAGAAVPPTPPVGVSATGDDAGCAAVSWSPNGETDVIGYRLYSGPSPGVYDDSTDVTGPPGVVCGLADGTHYFAVRAINVAGLLSGFSSETSASVTNGNVQPPLPPLFVNGAPGNAGCAEIFWVGDGNPQVVGYVVGYGNTSVEGGSASEYDMVIDVGNASSVTFCNLGTGTYYFAVRAKNHLDMLSAYSFEVQVVVTSTAVAIASFSAEPVEDRVELNWEITADETIHGFDLLRAPAGKKNQFEKVNTMPIPADARGFVDRTVAGGTDYVYTLVVLSQQTGETVSAPVPVRTNVLELELEQNVPNPFNPATSISFVLPATSPVRLDIYDVRGRLVRTLVDEYRPSGRVTVNWDGRDAYGQQVASGAYFYRLVTSERTLTRKMVLLK